MRASILILPILGSLFASACDTELPCDGEWALNNTAQKRTTLTPRDGPVHVTSYGAWTASSSGCWSDLVDHLRALDSPAGAFDPDHLTVESCLDACDSVGYPLAGVEWSRECYCGYTLIGNNRPVSNDICNYPCTGNPDELCGGPAALNLYVKNNYPFTVGPASPLGSYKGYAKTQCWQDPQFWNRVLPHTPSTDINQQAMTVEKCIDACAADGYSSAGLEYGRECYCGNVDYPIGQSTSMNECDMACLGDATEICGGRNRMIVYNKPAAPATVTKKGIIQIINKNNNDILGYLNKNSLGPSMYRIGPVEGQALTIQMEVPVAGTSGSQVRITATNGDTGYPLLGLVQGRDNADSTLKAGSFQYTYFTGVTGTPAGSTPQTVDNAYTSKTGTSRTVESDIWSINLSTGDLAPQWINPDGSKPTIAVFSQSTAVYAGGDMNAFHARYPAPVTPLKLKFIEKP